MSFKIYAKVGTHPLTIITVVEIRYANVYIPILDNWNFKIGDKIRFREDGETIYMPLHGGIIDRISDDRIYFIARM